MRTFGSGIKRTFTERRKTGDCGMMNRRRFLAITAVAATGGLVGYGRHKIRWQGLAMGADVSITLYGTHESQAAAALDKARTTIKRTEQLFSLYDPNSEISQLNNDQHREVPSEFMDLIMIADHAHRISDGLFDPTVQSAFAVKSGRVKPASDLRETVGWKHVSFVQNQIRFTRAGMAITLNGIAQGFATDKVSDVLFEHGFSRVLVNIGEFRAGNQWAHIGIGAANDGVIATEEIRNASIATSSANGFNFADGTSHILNPLNDSPPQWASATVIATDAAIADALSTAVILAKGSQLAERLIHDGNAKAILLEDFSGRLIRV